MLSQVSYHHRDSSLLVVLFQKQTWVGGMSDLKLEELAIETADRLEFKERNGLQTKLIADYEGQSTINE